MALAGGGQQINVLATSIASAPQSSGGIPIPAVYVLDGGNGDRVAAGSRRAGELSNWRRGGGGLGLPADSRGTSDRARRAAYLAAPLDAASHVDLIRRVTFNVSRVSNKTASSLILGQKLIGGEQTGMGVQKVAALLDREGGSYFQEWAALFVVAGGTGGRACFYYPRLQAAAELKRERSRRWKGRCSAICCTRNYAPCRVSIRMTARRCCATEATFRRETPGCSRHGENGLNFRSRRAKQKYETAYR